METVKNIVKFTVGCTLVVTGILVAGTIFTAKSVDKIGDAVEDSLHN